METGHMIPTLIKEGIPTSGGLTEGGWSSAIVAVALLIGGGIGWLLKSWKTRVEIRKLDQEIDKLRAETVGKAGELLAKVQDARKQYDTACIECGDAARRLLGLVGKKASFDEIIAAREELCSCLLNRTVSAFQVYVEWEDLRYKDDPSSLTLFISPHVVGELRRFAGWLKVINAEKLLSAIKRNPARISKSTLDPFTRLAARLPPDRSEVLQAMLNAAVTEIIDASEYPPA